MEEIVRKYFEEWKGEKPAAMGLLPASGSHRKYYRIGYSEGSVLGVYNESEEENAAYFSFTRQFRQRGLPMVAGVAIGVLAVAALGVIVVVVKKRMK